MSASEARKSGRRKKAPEKLDDYEVGNDEKYRLKTVKRVVLQNMNSMRRMMASCRARGMKVNTARRRSSIALLCWRKRRL